MPRLDPDQLEAVNDVRANEVLTGWQVEIDPHKCQDRECPSWHAGIICLGINEDSPDRLQFAVGEISFSGSEMVSVMLTQAHIVQLLTDLQAALSTIREGAMPE